MASQVDTNYAAFKTLLPALLAKHAGKFALLHNGEVVEFFDTPRDAFLAGQKLYESQDDFSVQEVKDTPVDLGYFSYALPQF
jgi:hypothetical protein